MKRPRQDVYLRIASVSLSESRRICRQLTKFLYALRSKRKGWAVGRRDARTQRLPK